MSRTLDIIIPTYNRSGIEPLAHALAAQCGIHDRILIVWQGSEPPSAANFPPTVTMIHRRQPNLPAARNCGIRNSRADIVLFLDDDVVPHDNLIEAHRACYEDPALCGVAGFVDDPLFDRSVRVPSSLDLSNGNCVQNFSLPESCRTISAMGANMSFLRSAVERAGGFDEHYLQNALWEEIDLCLRLQQSGKTLRYCAEARVIHKRDKIGGCRGSGHYSYLYHQFANTAYFAARFARGRDYGSWFTFWKYRLEYFSRRDNQASGPRRLRHDPAAVLAGAAGAAAGIARFIIAGLIDRRGIGAIDRNAVAKAVKP
ncbi:MAG: glycosyltransferase family 2 protein [Chitinispirillaceae bacterium]|jgi:GT2 family glycosyltransferase|nr:glycosyltransferase family 2 protein [Chitinispirillaceae bacterium]